jgi:uncharacterized damage-inducible protein DinB
MFTVSEFRQQFAYNGWANRETLRALAAAASPPQWAVEVMGHLVGAEWAWLRRLGVASPDMAVWPRLSAVECGEQLQALSAAWKAYFDPLTPPGLRHELSYVNFRGERWTNTVEDVLTHVFTHGCYHRGQIAMLLGRAGFAAPYTDYIECVRRGYLSRGRAE